MNMQQGLRETANKIVDLSNELRRQPWKFTAYLKQRIEHYDGLFYFTAEKKHTAITTEEGVKPVQELVEYLSEIAPLPKLEVSKALTLAAEEHAKYLSETDFYTHQGERNSQPGDRVSKYGTWKGNILENLECGFTTPKEIFLCMLVDDGLSNRPNRNNILNPLIEYIGVGVHPHKQLDFVTVVLFGTQVQDL